MNIIKKLPETIYYMSCKELITYLQEELGELKFSDYIANKFIEYQIDGYSFLLMTKKNLIEINIMDKYIMLCLIVPYALFANEFI